MDIVTPMDRDYPKLFRELCGPNPEFRKFENIFLNALADMRASRAVLSSSVWEIHGSVGEIPATGRY